MEYNIQNADNDLLQKLCKQYDVDYSTVEKLLDVVRKYQHQDRRTGVFDELKEILKSEPQNTEK